VQPGKSTVRRGNDAGSHFRVAPSTGGISAEVGIEVSTAMHGQNCSICRRSLQAPLSGRAGRLYVVLLRDTPLNHSDVQL
jgi:hypothetical protein